MEKDKLLSLLEDKNEFVVTIDDNVENHKNRVLACNKKYIRLRNENYTKNVIEYESDVIFQKEKLMWPMIVKFTHKIDELLCKKIVDYMEMNILKAIKKDNMYVLHKVSNELDSDICSDIFKICQELYYKYDIKINKDSGYIIKKIFNREVSDLSEDKSDKIMKIMIGLNNDYDGGEIYYPTFDHCYKLKRGEIICFPPYWTHPYIIYPPLNRTYFYLLETFIN